MQPRLAYDLIIFVGSGLMAVICVHRAAKLDGAIAAGDFDQMEWLGQHLRDDAAGGGLRFNILHKELFSLASNR